MTGASEPAATGTPALAREPGGVQVGQKPSFNQRAVLLPVVVDKAWIGHYKGPDGLELLHNGRWALGAVLDPMTGGSVTRRPVTGGLMTG